MNGYFGPVGVKFLVGSRVGGEENVRGDGRYKKDVRVVRRSGIIYKSGLC
jgi:hypothetical protein